MCYDTAIPKDTLIDKRRLGLTDALFAEELRVGQLAWMSPSELCETVDETAALVRVIRAAADGLMVALPDADGEYDGEGLWVRPDPLYFDFWSADSVS